MLQEWLVTHNPSDRTKEASVRALPSVFIDRSESTLTGLLKPLRGTGIVLSWSSSILTASFPFFAQIYALSLGVNYGAFSLAFSASLAGLLWKAILERKGITLRERDFARFNAPIIFVCMAVGCGVLAAQVYIVKDAKSSN